MNHDRQPQETPRPQDSEPSGSVELSSETDNAWQFRSVSGRVSPLEQESPISDVLPTLHEHETSSERLSLEQPPLGSADRPPTDPWFNGGDPWAGSTSSEGSWSKPSRSSHGWTYHTSAFTGGQHQWTFTTVGGHQRLGLLVDPGASRGLIGVDSLKEITDHLLRPRGLHKLVTWRHSNSTFAGISAKAEKSLGRVRFPIGMYGFKNAFFEADVIGNEASGCPGLVPLSTLMRLGCVLFFATFSNGDGLLGIRDRDTGQYHAQRLYLTDSGHYLLPISNFGKISRSDWD